MTPHHHRLSDVTPPPTAKTADAVGVSDRPGRRRGATTPYRAILDMTPDATVVHDRDGRITFVNRQTERLFGYPRAELLGQPVEQLIPARLQALHRQHLIDYTAAPDTRLMGATLQVLGRRRDGSEFPIEVTLSHLTAGGDVLLISTIRDVSEVQRVQAAHAALETRNRELLLLQALTETTLSSSALHDVLPTLLARVQEVLGVDNVAILLLDPEGQTLRLRASRGLEEAVVEQVHIPVGQGFAGTIAATRAPLIAEDLSTFPAVNPFLREHLRSAAGVPLLVADRLLGVLHIDTIQPHHFTVSEMQVLQHVAERVTLALDRAQAHEAAQAARAEAERQAAELDRIFEQIADGLTVFDAQVRVVRANAASWRLLGLDAAPPDYASLPMPEQITLFAMRDEQGHPLALEETPVWRVLHGEGHAGAVTRDVRMRMLDGRELEVNTSAAPLRDREGRLVGAVRVLRDQTERKRLEREREDARGRAERQAAQLDRIFEGIADGLVVYDANGTVVRTNAAARHILGLDAAPPDYARLPAGERAALFVARDEQDRPLANEAWPLIQVLSGRVATGAVSRDVRLRMLDGRELAVYTSAAPLRDQDGQLVGAVTILRDETERKQLERERAAQAAQLDRIFEGITDGLVVYDADGTIVRTNAGARAMLGLDAAPPDYAAPPVLEWMKLFAARDEQDHPLPLEELPLVRVLSGQVPDGAVSRDVRMQTPDGRELEVNSNVAPLQDAEGRLVGAVTILRDVTERNRLARERAAQAEQLDRVFEGMGDGVFVYDAQGQVVRTNPAARHILGLDAAPSDFYRLPWHERLALYRPRHGQDGHLLTAEEWLVPRALRGDVLGPMQTQDFRMRSLDGRELEVSTNVAPVRDQQGQIVGAITVLRDRTERNRLEREREAARVREEAALEVNQRMKQFLATASHDLRSPVTAALAGVQLAQRLAQQVVTGAAAVSADATPRTPHTRLVSTLERANQAMHRLDRLIGRLFDLTQVQLDQLELMLAPHNLTTLVRAAVASQRAASPERSIHLRVPTGRPVPVLADADRLDEVLTNYLTNAVKYAPADQPIDVRLVVEAGGYARVSVQDHGLGLPLEEQERIWELHHRVLGAAGQRGSLGLGLYLCKTLVERHGGQVGVDSVPGQGATFWFTLPLAAAEPAI